MASVLATSSIEKESPSDDRTLQQADLSGLLSTLSDELRQPLSIAIQLSQLLQRQYSGSLSPKQMALVETILQQNKYLLNRVDTCLQVAQLETTKQSLFLSPIDLKQLLPEVVSKVRSKLESQSNLFFINWRMERMDVVCDRNYLDQLLTKLLLQIPQLSPGTYPLMVLEQTHSWSLRILLPAAYPIDQLPLLEISETDNPCTLELAAIKALLTTLAGSILVQADGSARFVQLTLPKTLCIH